MHSLPAVFASLSLAVIKAYAHSESYVSDGVPFPGPPQPITGSPTFVDGTWFHTCPPAPTVFFNVTEYVPVKVTVTATASFTERTTASVTDTATEILTDTTTESFTNTSTEILTDTTIESVTNTATELLTETTTASLTTTATEVLTERFTNTTTASFTATTTASYTETTTTSITETTTRPVTIYQTIISTTVVTTTQTVTETETSTTVSPSPTTATATEKLLVSTFTTEVTSITLCPTRKVNPTYTASGPYPTDWTWGCPPGWLCRPNRTNCNFEAGIPDQNFYCAPNECIPAEALPQPLQTWNADIYGNATPLQDPSLKYHAIGDYFNMNPEDFGLTYEIFIVDEVFTVTSTTLLLPAPTPTLVARQAQTSVPGACYPWCNNCLLEAQARGKTSALCVPGSAFETSLNQCEQCISVHKSDSSGSFVQISPQFQQFLDYCAQYSTTVVTTATTSTSTVSSILSATVTSQSSVTIATSTGQSTSLTTVVATTATTETPTTSTTEILSTATGVSTLTGSAGSSPAIIPTTSSQTLPVITTTTATTVPTTMSVISETPSSSAAAQSVYTTTSTAITTIYSLSTITGTQWSQITIVLPLSGSSTTTVYGSDLTSGGASLVLPEASTTSSYLTTMTVTPGNFGADGGSATPTATGPATPQTTSPAPAAPSAFPGSASRLKVTSGDRSWQTMIIGLAIIYALALVL
ncbi:hypothetical protein HRR83_003084 [Exophiala dermatitidis]|uniref:Glycoprotein X n=1 Tax=Exophiala dermatitidis TaxID=5970 RepID=A0AAN6EPN6_EXODE|nr:hypothetical protein HRR75_007595 [Exophiala dermatitidis]KAJ4506373.1 hypothetical protein HRR73_008171 [Exophiala dermatitidis]KAJ4506954.1 hypothetical protein HRR74_008270 [Exophiala dermatitidis]KAJ4547956.1 hypothetical protein HRR76_000576 [Exophiala dermatitidis]KAJ4553897.1 hypothetical protein HRR77_002266 [Exophiala dermatitidis]